MIIAGKFHSLTGVWSRFCLNRNLKEKTSGVDWLDAWYDSHFCTLNANLYLCSIWCSQCCSFSWSDLEWNLLVTAAQLSWKWCVVPLCIDGYVPGMSNTAFYLHSLPPALSCHLVRPFLRLKARIWHHHTEVLHTSQIYSERPSRPSHPRMYLGQLLEAAMHSDLILGAGASRWCLAWGSECWFTNWLWIAWDRSSAALAELKEVVVCSSFPLSWKPGDWGFR